MANVPTPRLVQSRAWRVRGQVQGVGFRPFVHRLANSLGLTGRVRNDSEGVVVVASGSREVLDDFLRRLEADAPALARIDGVSVLSDAPADDPSGEFRIEVSDADPGDRGRVTVDAAVCGDCLREMVDPEDRRHSHALINCTNCGPRYTIVRDLPYDRLRTTMAGFPMCDACAEEYADPTDRRFHAQPVCCPDCGPTVRLLDPGGGEVPGEPFHEAARILLEGGVLALKGLGGYHLAVLATDGAAVGRLREGKGRDRKPFAVMVGDLDDARGLVRLSGEAEAVLRSPAAPVVLADRSAGSGLADGVAPGCHRVGVMLPSTPVHHLLLAEVAAPLVMTSANLTDDPLVICDGEARRRLGSFCSAFLVHDRPILRAVDDSVLIDSPTGLLPVRRARGFVPAPLPLPVPADRPGLATGGMLKGAVAIARGAEAVVSQHLGELDHALAYRRFLTTIRDLERLYDVRPEWIAADLHPQYPTHRYALGRAAAEGLEIVYVQHHHAHFASLLAEHGRTGPAVGIVCDGVGYGEDGTAWGGEILVGDLGGSERLGRVRPLSLPGGDAAAKETGRCAMAWLHDLLGEAAGDHPIAVRIIEDEARRRTILDLLRTGARCPESSGLGRLFDATAALLGLARYNHFEAMSGLMLEAVASSAGEVAGDGVVELVERDGLLELDHRPLLARLLEEIERGAGTDRLARLFHVAVADGLARGAERVAKRVGLSVVGLSGGVFCNTLLTQLVEDRLAARGFEVLIHRMVPPNDGGIAYGQAAAAAARISETR